MSEQATIIRNKRRAIAAPGGRFDRVIRLLAIGLPALVGAVAAAMLIAPLSPRGEVSFLLDRNKVAIADDRMRVDDAMYRGQDNRGRPFSLSAAAAVQQSIAEPIVQMDRLTARLLLPEGPALLTAPGGRYFIDEQQVQVDGLMRFTAADGYRMTARDVFIDLPARTLLGRGRVEGAIPAGTFSADTIRADLAARTLTLEGDARMRMVPGQLALPQGLP
jgi:lipopolysaccharide export system protein LptC